jgi:hypothetical protein
MKQQIHDVRNKQFIVKGEDGRRQLWATLSASELSGDSMVVIGDWLNSDQWWKRTVSSKAISGRVTTKDIELENLKSFDPRTNKMGGEIPFSLARKADAYTLLEELNQDTTIKHLVLVFQSEEQKRFLELVLSGAPQRNKRWEAPELTVYHIDCEWYDYQPTDDDEDCLVSLAGDWRKETSTFAELPQEQPKMLVEHLIPEKALTVMAAPSYTGKTHIAIEVGLALATGTNFLEHFKGPVEPVPVIYHVPELHASLFRSFMLRLGAEERLQGRLDNFLIRTLERDLWPLDSPQMIDSSRGRYVFLDTFGYFNDGDDSASYNQAIEFAKKINNLIREGCLGVCGLYHPPKYSKDRKTTGNVMTLENQILGSAGYGGVLRSCLGMRNLHEDSNKGLWVYVQGVKNPGLQGPFQIEGVPLRLIKKPGESPYLSELLSSDTGKRERAIVMIKEGKGRREICSTLNVSSKTLSKWKQNDLNFDSNQGEEEHDNDAE